MLLYSQAIIAISMLSWVCPFVISSHSLMSRFIKYHTSSLSYEKGGLECTLTPLRIISLTPTQAASPINWRFPVVDYWRCVYAHTQVTRRLLIQVIWWTPAYSEQPLSFSLCIPSRLKQERTCFCWSVLMWGVVGGTHMTKTFELWSLVLDKMHLRQTVKQSGICLTVSLTFSTNLWTAHE